jgi:hypothetical protein
MNIFQSTFYNFYQKIETLYLIIAKKYVNILIVIGIVLCLITPLLIYFFTGINIYISDTSSYSLQDYLAFSEGTAAEISGADVRPFFYIRICLATILFNLIVLLFLLNYNKLTGS